MIVKLFKRAALAFGSVVMLNVASANDGGAVAQPKPVEQAPELLFFAEQNRLQCYQQDDENGFYVLSTGGDDFPKAKLSQYQLTPFQRLKTVELPSLPMPFGRYEDAVVLPIKGSSKLAIYNIKSLMIYDFASEKVLHKREFDVISKGVVLKNGQLHVFFKHPLKRSQIAFRVYSTSDLSLVKEAQLRGESFGSDYRGNSYSWFSSLAGNLVEIPRDMATQPQLVFYDENSLQPRLIINHRDAQRDQMSTQTFYHVAPDFSKLYISTLYNQAPVYDFSEESADASLKLDESVHIEVDLNNKMLNSAVPHVPKNAIEMPLGHIYYQGLSESKRFVWIDGVYLIDKQHGQIYQFHQFADGEALIKGYSNDKLMVTPKALAHVQMRTQNGQLVQASQESLKAFLMEMR